MRRLLTLAVAILIGAAAARAAEIELAWEWPTENVDGLHIIDLKEARIYGSQASEDGPWTLLAIIPSPTPAPTNSITSTAVLKKLKQGNWWFRATALNTTGMESDPTPVVFDFLRNKPNTPANFRKVQK